MAHCVLVRCGVENLTHISIASCYSLAPYGLSWRNNQVECESEKTDNLFGRDLSAHIVEWSSLQEPGTDIITRCCTDAGRV